MSFQRVFLVAKDDQISAIQSFSAPRKEVDVRKVIVLTGIGARNYYRRFGYAGEGPYMVREL